MSEVNLNDLNALMEEILRGGKGGIPDVVIKDGVTYYRCGGKIKPDQTCRRCGVKQIGKIDCECVYTDEDES
ncbi:MAG: hypothetical protein IPH09_12910 [bacterium]|nr:hypothetical protein [bacterium]